MERCVNKFLFRYIGLYELPSRLRVLHLSKTRDYRYSLPRSEPADPESLRIFTVALYVTLL